jgi:hypothetical protein
MPRMKARITLRICCGLFLIFSLDATNPVSGSWRIFPA